ncbi:MAG TPA: hypothetical protein VGV87_09165 [Blastocatellia bacterium]|nr:hypothetical protein [Blastocatellia bacterium]
MKGILRFALVVLAILLACLPFAFIATFLLYPFWSWVEATFAIESVGHSGPAEWCFGVVYILLCVVSVSAVLLLRRRQRHRKTLGS